MITPTRFRSPINNARYTAQLFWDAARTIPSYNKTVEPLYTLHDDIEGLINFRKEYIRDMDPTGFKTANRLLENYDHWQLLMKCTWFQKAKVEWDKELAAKMEAEAMDELLLILRDDSTKNGEKISAAKTLMGKAKVLKAEVEGKPKRGRPTAEEVEGELKEQARLTKEELEDLERIRAVK